MYMSTERFRAGDPSTGRGVIVGLVCFALISLWWILGTLMLMLAEVTPWKLWLALVLPTAGWGVLCFYLGESVASHNQTRAMYLGAIVGLVVLLALAAYLAHEFAQWPF